MKNELDGVTDIRDRRRIQNRLSQRKRRDRLRSLSLDSQARPPSKNNDIEAQPLFDIARTLRAALGKHLHFQPQGPQEWDLESNDDFSSIESLLATLENSHPSGGPSAIDMNNKVDQPTTTGPIATSLKHIVNDNNNGRRSTALSMQILPMSAVTTPVPTLESALDPGLQDAIEPAMHYIQHKSDNLGEQHLHERINEEANLASFFLSSISEGDPFSTRSNSSSIPSSSSHSETCSDHAHSKRLFSDRPPSRHTPPGLFLLKVDEIISQLVSLYKFATDLELIREQPGLLDLLDTVQAKFHAVSYCDSSVQSPSHNFRPNTQ